MGDRPVPALASEPLPLSAAAARQLDVCVHCGFCLPACPTYRELGAEADSPRGRIDIIGAAFRGEVSAADPDVAHHLDRCLDCRACESACPSGVQYHLLYEEAVAHFPSRRPWLSGGGAEAVAFGAASGLIRAGLRRLVQRPRLLAWAVRLAPLLPPLRHRLPAGMAALLPGLPRPHQRPARLRLPPVVAARGEKRGEVLLFLGCIQDAVFGEDNAAMARTLAACGYEVHLHASQTCCGALHVHVGDRRGLQRLAARNLRALAGNRPIVLGAAGCSAVLKEYGRLLADTPLAAEAAGLAARVRDFGEFVAALPQLPVALPPAGAPVRVTWHDPCHLVHAQGVRRAPRVLLGALPGVQCVELEEADACCGSAGVYNLVQPELSGQILARKVANIAATGARWVVTENPGCALQLRAGLAQAGLDVRVVSLAQVLAEAYGGEAR
jgi:glycolate oxidase iron-sulfur subunit